MCINPYQGIVMFCLLLFSPTSKKVYVELWVGINKIATCIAYVVKSNRGSKERNAILLDQDVHVCGKW